MQHDDPLRGLLADVEGADWSALGSPIDAEKLAELDEKQRAQGLAIASDFRQCFETEAGGRVLQHLLRATLMRPTVSPDSTQFEAGINEGRCAMVRDIYLQIQAAKDGG